jgi:PAS domain S-box-containing protein/putative nucleotidyltransferase with HDIG domain
MKQVVEDMKKNHEKFKVGRIMIVDDEVELMTALCEALAVQGYETMGFTTGADALKVLVEQDYDLLLTDLMMPEMDGIALLQAGLEIDPNLVGIIMTGHGTVQTAVEAMKTGAFDYVLKPFKLNTLLPLLSRAMEVRSLRMENIQLRETVAIHELGKVIAFSSDLNAILNKVADATLQQCTADEVSIMLPTRDGKELYVAVARGGHREYIGERVPMDRGIAGWVARHRETVIINGKVDDPRFSPVNPRADIRAAVSMPMMAGGNLVGVLNVNVTRSHRHMTLGQVKALSILVSIISPILENTWLNIQIRQAEEKYRSIFENAIEGIYQTTPEGQFIIANRALATMLGYDSPEELMSTVTDIANQLYVIAEERTKLKQMIEDHGQVKSFETRLYRKDGRTIWVSISIHAVCDKKGELLNYDGIAEDITERKETEAWLLRERSMVDRIMKTSPAAIMVVNQAGRICFANNRAENLFSLTRSELTQLTYNSHKWRITDYDGNPFPEEQQPFTQVLTTGNSVYGVCYAIELPDGQRMFLLVNGAPVFDEQGHIREVVLIIDDITKYRQAEEKIQQGLKQLEKSMGETIKAMSTVVETRDPYTAGHHDKVARLADAIAKKMNLSEEMIRGIQMAGVIHDIGKMHIPADILSKPGKLSNIEMQLLKTHSQSGYDIMKHIDFPWPVARIILEHHERMDGSGYPNGRSNNDILLESRIVAIADVVDAMASHRPYRTALGIDVALREIEKNKGLLYDTDAVDACLMLFREEGFQLEGI